MAKKKQAEPAAAEPLAEIIPAKAHFPIVGIGASAGGLAAFEAFFSGMPADKEPGMAFVLVQHLAPDHKSILTDLIRRYTRMQVFEVEDGVEVQPNCAYIIPPNCDMAFLNGTLQLLEPAAPRGQRLPIDYFFRSLAQDQHELAICIVLSGTGSDGTLGLRAIKGEGGMAMVQNPESTEYDGMPRSAINTGLVDYVLPPGQMEADGYLENWITYKSPDFSAKELTVLPGRSVTIHDAAAYGMILLQGHGRMGVWEIDSPAIIRFGQLTMDEFYVTETAAREGVVIKNPSRTDPLVMLKHFGPGNPDLKL